MIDWIKSRLYRWLRPVKIKEACELSYWKSQLASESVLSNDHYMHFFTEHFGLSPDFYTGKRVLDIGCGPRGSLEWAHMTMERVGLDPLAEEYLALGAGEHRMCYVRGHSEAIPFHDHYFDIVSSFNSLDHVVNLKRTIAEIARVTKLGGLFLLLSDVNHKPTPCEPIRLSWDIANQFAGHFAVVEQRKYEKSADGIYQSIHADIVYDHNDPTDRYGIISAKLVRKEA